MVDIETRLIALEKAAARHQAQVDELRSHNKGLLLQLEVLQLQHSSLHESHHLLCKCFLDGRIDQADLAQQRLRVQQKGKSLHAVLDHWQVLLTVSRFLGACSGTALSFLVAAARSYTGLSVATKALASRNRLGDVGNFVGNLAIHQLDHSVWGTICAHEPPEQKLAEWARSHTVQAVLGCFGIEGILGQAGVMKFEEVLLIFSHIGLSLESFVNRFRHIPTIRNDISKDELEKTARSILNRFSIASQPESGHIKCKDFFRLLEIFGVSLQKFKEIFPTAASVFDNANSATPLVLGDWRIRRQVGQGFKGVRCYLGEHVRDASLAAVKFPAPRDEVSIVKEIYDRVPKDCNGFDGLPKLLFAGVQNHRHIIVTELLGSPLTKVIDRLKNRPFVKRWHGLRIIGRMLVRRLQQFHCLGYVHCDMSPENILLGTARDRGHHLGRPKRGLYLIDFELAQKYPGGSKDVEGTIGSAEWSSIRSMDKGERRPEDDLESVGWILMHGLYGYLPWFEYLNSAYEHWNSKWIKAQTIKQVQRAKIKLLEEGWKAFGWRSSERIPEELLQFLRACRCPIGAPLLPSYQDLICLLGGDVSCASKETEQNDVDQFEECVMKLL